MKKNPKHKEIIKKYNDTIINCIDLLFTKYRIFYKTVDDIVLYYPINIKKKLDLVKDQFNLNLNNKSDINPIYIIEEICKVIEYCKVNDNINNTLIILLHDVLSPKKILRDYRITKVAFDYLINLIMTKFDNVLVEGGEMVGPLAAQSIGEKSTQLTLNSVEYNTELLIKVDGIIKRVKIGEWIDSRIKNADPVNIEKHPKDTTLEYIKDCKVKILSVTEKGKIIWDDVDAVTKHPVINKDGSNTLLKVTTHSGREVIATKGKSFLKRINNKILKVDGDKLKVGDYLPVSNIFPTPKKSVMKYWDYSVYIPKNEFVYMSEVNKAIKEQQRIIQNGGRHWFKDNKNFCVPYKRSDAFMDVYNNQFKEECTNTRNEITRDFKQNCVYPLHRSKDQVAHLPEKIKLDNLFGFFVGAYLAEGHSTKYQVLISNNDDDYMDKIKEFADRYELKYHIDDQQKNGGRSRTLRIHSLILAQLFIKSMGKTSDLKRVPAEFFNTRKSFLKGLIDGYISGDGTIEKKSGRVSASSISRGLLEDIRCILARFKIFAKITTDHASLQYNLDRGLKARLSYTLDLSKVDSYRFSEKFKLVVDDKQKRLNMMKPPTTKYSFTDYIPDIKTNEFGTITIKRNELNNYIEEATHECDRKIFKKILDEDISYDKVTEIQEIKPSKGNYVYDLTTRKTKKFCLGNLLAQNDTFHLAGVGEKSNVTRGVPRLHELLSNTKNPKQPMCVIYLDKKHRHDFEMAQKIGNNIESTTIEDLLLSDGIYLDMDNTLNNVLPEDKEIMEIYKTFCSLSDNKLTIENNMWVIKLEFDRKKIIESKVSMSDIQVVLSNKYPNAVLVYMDDNANKLIFRIKLDFEANPANCDDDIIYLKEKLEEIKTTMIKGVMGITKVYYEEGHTYYEKIGDVYEARKEYVITTDGSNLFDVLITEGVDTERTFSIDPNEMNSIFGIEAARYTIEDQINDVLSGSDANTSPRHVSLLCNKMTRGGDIMSVDRHGINKENIGPLAKSSFEETTDQLLVASLFGDKDNITGVSANIMVGQMPPCGTGNSRILLDEDMLESQNNLEDQEEIDFNKYFESNAYCAENDDIKFNINAIPEEDIELDEIPEVVVS